LQLIVAWKTTFHLQTLTSINFDSVFQRGRANWLNSELSGLLRSIA